MQKTKFKISHLLVGILLAALIVACEWLVYQNWRHQSVRKRCLDNLRQLELRVFSEVGDMPFPTDVDQNAKSIDSTNSNEETRSGQQLLQGLENGNETRPATYVCGFQ